MKRIIAALSGKVEKVKMERKVNRINRAIETATDNAKDAIDRIEEQKANLVEKISMLEDTNAVICELSNLIGDQEEQEATIERLEKVKAYLNDEIEVEDEKEK